MITRRYIFHLFIFAQCWSSSQFHTVDRNRFFFRLCNISLCFRQLLIVACSQFRRSCRPQQTTENPTSNERRDFFFLFSFSFLFFLFLLFDLTSVSTILVSRLVCRLLGFFWLRRLSHFTPNRFIVAAAVSVWCRTKCPSHSTEIRSSSFFY